MGRCVGKKILVIYLLLTDTLLRGEGNLWSGIPTRQSPSEQFRDLQIKDPAENVTANSSSASLYSSDGSTTEKNPEAKQMLNDTEVETTKGLNEPDTRHTEAELNPFSDLSLIHI